MIAKRLRAARAAYPGQFWTLFFGTLVNSAGGSLIFPFFSLYLTEKLQFSMTEVGILFGLYALVSLVAQVAGGSMVDRAGRKPVMVFSLYGSALAILAMGLVGTAAGPGSSLRLPLLVLLVLLFGLTGNIFTPAMSAMVADIVPAGQLTPAFSLLRIVTNIGVALGPAVGGFIAGRSYLTLFASAAAASLLYGLIVSFLVRETRPAVPPDRGNASAEQPPGADRGGYGPVLRDRVFLLFYGLFFLSTLVYVQSTTTLPVYLKESFGVAESTYGLMMSTNALLVVVFQLPLSAWINRRDLGRMMALGMVLYALGFGLFAFVRALPLFFLAQITWTLGEMVTSPLSQSFVAEIAPADMRGRYMGVSGLAWGVAYGLGPLLGGMVMDGLGGRAIWMGAIALNALAAAGYLLAAKVIRRAVKERPNPRPLPDERET